MVNSKYQAYIDSLRAIAVGIIILFHFNLPFFSGGYVGVDVFFVISGFLVTRKIVDSINAGNFSFLGFYANRIRRIFPALFALLVCVILFDWIFIDYDKFRQLGASVSSIAVFLSNVIYWRQSGYFENFSIENPLLHIWSLSVEEQFYFILPLVIVLGKSFLKSRFPVSLLVLAFLSFAAFWISMVKFPDAGFYLLPARMWEFLTGSLLSTFFISDRYTRKSMNVLSVLGFALLAICIYLNSLYVLTLGPSIFLSVAGAALIILSGFHQGSITHQILNFRPLVFTGKISYSLYLWHWPVYCLASYINNGELGVWQTAFCLILSFVMGYLSWLWVEVPFRKRFYWIKHTALTYAFFVAASCLLVFVGILIYVNKGFPARFPENEKLLNINQLLDKWVKLRVEVNSQFEEGKPMLTIGSQQDSVSFLVWGDSHALALSAAIDSAAKINHAKGYFLTRPGSPPILGISEKKDPTDGMLLFNGAVIRFIAAHPEIKTVFLAARWAYYADHSFPDELPGRIIYRDTAWKGPEYPDSVMVGTGIRRTVKQLLHLNRKVVLISPVPEQKYDVAKYFVKKRIYRMFGQNFSGEPLTVAGYNKRANSVNKVFAELAKEPNIIVLKVDELFRSGDKYLDVVNNNPLYRDKDHLSFYGLNYVQPMFDNYFRQHPQK